MIPFLVERVPVLRRMPGVLRGMLDGLPDEWIRATEGPDTWSPFDIVGHLIHGELSDWIPRAEHILAQGEATPFAPFDRTAMLEESKGRTMVELLDTFAAVRGESVARLEALNLSEGDLTRVGLHPSLGRVTLAQLLATWVAHDLGHVAQVARVMAKGEVEAVGPWKAYLPVLTDRPSKGS